MLKLAPVSNDLTLKSAELKIASRRLRHLSHGVVVAPLGWSAYMRRIGVGAKAFWEKQHDKN